MSDVPQWFVWFTMIQAVGTLITAVYAASLKWSFKTGGHHADTLMRLTSAERRLDGLDLRVTNECEKIARRVDNAGQKMSDLGDEIQKLPDRMRDEFVSSRVVEMGLAEWRRDRDKTSDEIKGVREDVRNLWAFVRQKPFERKDR